MRTRSQFGKPGGRIPVKIGTKQVPVPVLPAGTASHASKIDEKRAALSKAANVAPVPVLLDDDPDCGNEVPVPSDVSDSLGEMS